MHIQPKGVGPPEACAPGDKAVQESVPKHLYNGDTGRGESSEAETKSPIGQDEGTDSETPNRCDDSEGVQNCAAEQGIRRLVPDRRPVQAARVDGKRPQQLSSTGKYEMTLFL